MTIRIERLTGAEIEAYLDALAGLRISVFRAFPYLYDGDMDYEREYLRSYAKSARSVIVGAFDGGDLIGAATALPMADEPDYVTGPFAARGYDTARVFYFGESVLRPEYRGRGIGVAFFGEREAHARSFGGFTHAAFCAVIRPPDHPRRPADFVPLDGFWRKRGYAPMPGFTLEFTWRDLDETAESDKPMAVWVKAL